MNIKVDRIFRNNEYTIGELYCDNVHMCDTLEDVVRNLPKTCPYTSKCMPCKCNEKINGKTAIPEGEYDLIISYSNKFKKELPEILNVPHFLGIRIHSGNSTADTDGCILVGEWDGVTPNWITNSRVAFNKIFSLIKKAVNNNEKIKIIINNLIQN